jgi:class 3 adenylate cyclase
MVRRHLGWGMTSLAEWLASIGLGEYARRLAEEAVDFPDLRDLTEQDLKDLGLPLGHRRRMLRAIAELNTGGLGRRQKSPELVLRDEAERRQVTVICCDMVGSTALSTRLDPEDMRQVIAPYQKRISEVIADHQGRARYVGDGVFATFGSPEAHEDDVEQAVRAGLVLIETVPKIKTEVDAALQIRLGIATGTVIVGEVVGHGIGLQDVVGETPNLAARLQALAEPGTMLMCANTHRLTEGYFECRDLGALTINGWTEPVRAWQVLGPSEVESRFRARHRTILPSLIGREEEVTLLSIRWRQTVQGEGRVVVLTGEPGIGKSHIALAFEEQVAAEPNIALELYRLKANALRLRGAPEDEVEALLDRGLQTARGQQARSLELRAATDLARLWETQGKRVQAREVLGPIRGRFGGGRNIRDLEAATAILARL